MIATERFPLSPVSHLAFLSFGDVADNLVKPHVSIQKSAEEACKGAEAIVVCTEWDEFKTLDWEKSEFSSNDSLLGRKSS